MKQDRFNLDLGVTRKRLLPNLIAVNQAVEERVDAGSTRNADNESAQSEQVVARKHTHDPLRFHDKRGVLPYLCDVSAVMHANSSSSHPSFPSFPLQPLSS